jgi:apolipoprotein N-acyltransferase
MVKNKKTFSKSGRVIIAVALSILSGGLLFFAYPPVNCWPLIWVAIIPYLIAQYRFMPRRWAPLAPAITNTLFLWPYLARIFGVPDAPFLFKHMGSLFGVATFFMSTERKLHELTRYKWFVLQGIFAWVGFEMIRGLIPVLGTMGFVGNTLASQAWLIQPISIFSIYGLNFLIVLVNYTLAYLALRWVDTKYTFDDTVPVKQRSTKKWMIITAGLTAIWIASSLVLYSAKTDTPTIKVASLHTYLDAPGHQIDAAEQAARVEKYSTLAREAAEEGAEVIFLTEMGFGFNPQEEYTDELRALSAETNAYMFIPYAYSDEADGWHNETVILSPEGKFSTLYGKLHAFGEPPTVTAGKFPVLESPQGTLGSIICMDSVFTDAARNVSKNGAQILGIPAYNSTVGISEHNWTHFLMRSVENRVPVVSTGRGLVSMITDARGKILAFAQTPEGGEEVLVADVKLGTGSSPYHFAGDWFGWVALAGFVFFIIFQGVVEKRAKDDSGTGKGKNKK